MAESATLPDQWQSMTVPQLKELLGAKGLRTTGRKDELVERLLEHARQEPKAAQTLFKPVRRDDLTPSQQLDLSSNEGLPSTATAVFVAGGGSDGTSRGNGTASDAQTLSPSKDVAATSSTQTDTHYQTNGGDNTNTFYTNAAPSTAPPAQSQAAPSTRSWEHMDRAAVFAPFTPATSAAAQNRTSTPGNRSRSRSPPREAGAKRPGVCPSVIKGEECWAKARGRVCAYESHSAADLPPRFDLHVTNFPPMWTEAELRAYFSRFGPITSINLTTARGRPVAFVRYSTRDTFEAALKGARDQPLEGIPPITVHMARSTEQLLTGKPSVRRHRSRSRSRSGHRHDGRRSRSRSRSPDRGRHSRRSRSRSRGRRRSRSRSRDRRDRYGQYRYDMPQAPYGYAHDYAAYAAAWGYPQYAAAAAPVAGNSAAGYPAAPAAPAAPYVPAPPGDAYYPTANYGGAAGASWPVPSQQQTMYNPHARAGAASAMPRR